LLLVLVFKKGFIGLTLACFALAAGPVLAQEPAPAPPDQAPPSTGTPPEQAQPPEEAPPTAEEPPEAPPAPEEPPRQRVQIRSVESPPAAPPVEDPAPAAPDRPPASAAHAVRSEAGTVRVASAPAAPVPAAALPPPAPERAPRADEKSSRPAAPEKSLPDRIVPRPVRQIAEVVPAGAWAALAVLALLAILFAASSWVASMRARRLRRQRESLLQEVGLLQAALLPAVPAGLPVSVAYRPAEDATAGGDFYEAFALTSGRTGLVLGDMSGHGRDALARTTFVRYTLRAYLEAGLEPRDVLKVGSAALAEHLDGGFATVTVAVYDSANGRFTYASAGHPPPVVAGGDAPFEPVIACPAPPLGIGEPTGFRQSMFTLTSGARVCLYTDGVTEARVDGGLFGVGRFEQALAALPPDADAEVLLDSVAGVADEIRDDMAVCLVTAPPDAPATGPSIEELEVTDEHEVGDSLERFLRACGVPLGDVPGVLREAGEAARREGSVTVRVRANDFRPGVDVVPGNLERLTERRPSARIG
jgi:hypothetical protein